MKPILAGLLARPVSPYLRLPALRPWQLTLSASLLLVLFYNHGFWQDFVDATGGASWSGVPLYLGAFCLLVLLFNALLSMAAFPYVLKPLLMALFFLAAACSYFIDRYGVAIDVTMVQNVMETDLHEATELWSWNLVLTLLLMGVAPSLLVWRIRVRHRRPVRTVLVNAGVALVSATIAVVLLMAMFKTLAPAVREHRQMRFLLTPVNVIQASRSYVHQKFAQPLVVAPLGRDVAKGRLWAGQTRRTVTVLVVGETARAQNFSLNGYRHDTNPLLSQQADLVNFSQVQSCGTATAVSVPCVFSSLTRDDYTEEKAKSQEGLLDVISHAGIDVLWRDNNSGCKGACDRVTYEDMSQPKPGDPFCSSEECYDERLLQGLPEIIRNARRDLVIVLHQKGSHGPAYWKRYPAAFQHFGPVCDSNELEKCTQASITAAYDNTIRYTDYFLSKTIDLLRAAGAEDGVDTAMLYFSDHGESLGEKNMYLHGAPYLVAPEEQRHVPMMTWLADSYRSRFHIEQRCLLARRGQEFSHDNVFHSVLGVLNLKTAVYNPQLDLFHACTLSSQS